MAGELDKLSGKLKQAGGKATDDKDMQAKGKLEELKGKAKSMAEDVKDAVNKNIKN